MSQITVSRVIDEAVGENLQGCFNSIAQVISNPTSLLDCQEIVFFEETFMGTGKSLRKTGSVEQTIEESEIGELFSCHHLLEVKFDISLFSHPLGIAENSKSSAVRDQTPNLIGAIKIFLEERMGCETRSS